MPVNRTYVVGLTGGIGCGKSEAAKYLESLGAKHVDADAISHELTENDAEALTAIRAAFGSAVFGADGALDRRALGEIVFSDAAQKIRLEAILHPLIQRRVMDEIDAASMAGVAVTVLNVPLLFECGMDALCDETWTMTADPEVQVERIRERDGLSEEQARARIASQLPAQERDARADLVIDTDRPLEKTQAELEKQYRRLLRRIG